jgi:D-arabinose 1-dehydrogenase-like Zn-dependent alcohol dehydrogenase
MAHEQKTWTGKAIVARDTLANKGWKLEEVTTREIQDDELLVELVASGICHTDIMCGSGSGNPDLFYYPRVLGHEGKGYIERLESIAVLTYHHRFRLCQSCWLESSNCKTRRCRLAVIRLVRSLRILQKWPSVTML